MSMVGYLFDSFCQLESLRLNSAVFNLYRTAKHTNLPL